ncbi:MAG: polymerase sigma factor, sigma-70 family [Anaerocolumna sp.]|jgi:RNA polymerase sigma-70 factor (ECF subfamily)|nr:polymerase sigma factor, sigma-70 family [Anaerocolumna sp.]
MGLHKKEYVLLVQESKEMLYRIAYGYLGNETLSIDAVDEAVYLGYIHRKEVRNLAYSKTWLTRILINECYRLQKRQKHC